MRTLAARSVLLLVLLAPTLVSPAAPADAGNPPALLLDGDYPVEVSLSFPASLLHWLDSLAALNGAGMTAGKTVEAHRRDFHGLWGPPTPHDLRLLTRFRDARVGAAERSATTDLHAMTRAFFAAEDLEPALGAANSLLADEERADFDTAIRHFAGRYRPLWVEPNAAGDFLARAQRDDSRAALGRFLASMARFYGVPADAKTRPRVVLVPVRPGHGTHAQAIGRFLLIEIRPGDDLADQVAPIVHETAHFLFERLDARRAEALARVARDLGPAAEEAMVLLREALPTALGQGVADRRLGPGDWSPQSTWYHLPGVDALAKRIYPLVRDAFDGGRRLDEPLLRELLSGATAAP